MDENVNIQYYLDIGFSSIESVALIIASLKQRRYRSAARVILPTDGFRQAPTEAVGMKEH